MLKDYDPYDYAKAVRVFQKAEKTKIQFDFFIESNPEILAIEVVSANGARCVQTELNTKGNLMAKNGSDKLSFVSAIELGIWISVEFNINSKRKNFTLTINDKNVAEKFRFSDDGMPERIIFRTGEYRLTDDVQKWKSGEKNVPGWDEPGADEQSQEATYLIKNFSVIKE
jgi:hypothetical protein